MMSQFVWVKKHDLAYALRVPPDIEADLAGRTASFWSLLLCVWRGGLNNRITVCTSQSGKPLEFGQPRAPIMKTTGGGLLGPEELEVLRPVKQIISGIKTNSAGKIVLENGAVMPCDWVIWCHGYDVRCHRRRHSASHAASRPTCLRAASAGGEAQCGGASWHDGLFPF